MGKRPLPSSSDEEEDAEAQKRLLSCIVGDDLHKSTQSTQSSTHKKPEDLKYYQVRLQDQLHQYLDRTVEICHTNINNSSKSSDQGSDADDLQGFQLFTKAPSGITLAAPPSTKPTSISPSQNKRYDHRLRKWRFSGEDKSSSDRFMSIAVDGAAVKEQARKSTEKALRKWKADLLKQELAISKEDERVRLLKQKRGEKWLLSK